MALRDQPYIPLYVQDFLTDEKLNECSAESTGVYIRLMCIMHKSQEYGSILLQQKYKQNSSKVLDFACKLARQMPYTTEVIERSLTELIEEGVLSLDGDVLYQKRMVRDGKLSEIRALAAKGKKGAKQNSDICSDFANDFAPAKTAANSEIESESENECEDESESEHEEEHKPRRKKPSSLSKTQELRFNQFWASYPRKVSIGDAEKAWAKISPDEGLTTTIIAAVDTARKFDSRFRETKYTPYPASWLNSKSWENQYDGPEDKPPAPLRGNSGRPDTLGVLEQMLNEGGDRF